MLCTCSVHRYKQSVGDRVQLFPLRDTGARLVN